MSTGALLNALTVRDRALARLRDLREAGTFTDEQVEAAEADLRESELAYEREIHTSSLRTVS